MRLLQGSTGELGAGGVMVPCPVHGCDAAAGAPGLGAAADLLEQHCRADHELETIRDLIIASWWNTCPTTN